MKAEPGLLYDHLVGYSTTTSWINFMLYVTPGDTYFISWLIWRGVKPCNTHRIYDNEYGEVTT